MICPRTNAALETLRIGPVKVSVSTGCGGIWFPNFQLKRSEDMNSKQRVKLIELSRRYRNEDDIDTTARVPCPADDGVVLMRRFFSFKKEIEIDECGRCGGVWLDPGEFEKILKTYHSAQGLSEKARREKSSEVIRQLNEESRQIKEKDRRQELARRYRYSRHATDCSLLWLATGVMIADPL